VNDPWIPVAVCAALLVLALAACLLTLRRARRALEATRHEAAELRAVVEDVAARVDAGSADPSGASVEAPQYLITDLGAELVEPPVAQRIEGRLFADIVLRETVVKAASLTHGVRRALAPETRNRIRFEIRREVKRSRKQRRADLKAARREWGAARRARPDEEDAA